MPFARGHELSLISHQCDGGSTRSTIGCSKYNLATLNGGRVRKKTQSSYFNCNAAIEKTISSILSRNKRSPSCSLPIFLAGPSASKPTSSISCSIQARNVLRRRFSSLGPANAGLFLCGRKSECASLPLPPVVHAQSTSMRLNGLSLKPGDSIRPSRLIAAMRPARGTFLQTFPGLFRALFRVRWTGAKSGGYPLYRIMRVSREERDCPLRTH
jgi:hypothetical protein